MEQFLKQFKFQRNSAKRRNIEWQFTFEEWLDWWGDDIHNRGISKDKLVMARFGDTGPYHPNNVSKKTNQENAREAHLGKNKSEGQRNLMRKPKTKEHALNIKNAVTVTWANEDYKKQRVEQSMKKTIEKFKNMSEEDFLLWKKRFEGKSGSALSNLKRAEKIREQHVK